MSNLIAHCGAWKTTEEEVRAVHTPHPMPVDKPTHFPIPHGEFLDQIYEVAPDYDLEIADKQFALAKNGDRLFGVLNCQTFTQGVSIAIGIRQSHDKTMSAGLCAGSRVFVCDNLAFSAEVVSKRKHSRNILRDLPGVLRDMFRKLPNYIAQERAYIEDFRGAEITDQEAYFIMVEAVKRGTFPATKLPAVLHNYHEPKHEEFAPRNAWSLLNAYTEVQKVRSPQQQMQVDLFQMFVLLLSQMGRIEKRVN
jgi:hypothetical protein